MTEIPEAVMKAAREVFERVLIPDFKSNHVNTIARAIQEAIVAERERIAKRLDEEASMMLDDIVEHDIQGEKEVRFAAGVLMSEAAAIRKGAPHDPV